MSPRVSKKVRTSVAVACALCAVALWFVPETPRVARAGHYGRTLLAVLKDLWDVARTRMGFLALLICFLPIGSGAASNLWSAVADDWHASANTVALATGVFNGIVSAIGMLGERGEQVRHPIVVRLDGNNAAEGRRILDEAGIGVVEQVATMDDAARRAAELASANGA